jgi:hypothetical protein
MVPATWEVEVGGPRSKAARQKFITLYEKQTKSKRIGGVTQVTECLHKQVPSLSSLPSTTDMYIE